MIWWILLGGLVLGLVVLALAVRPVLARLPGLQRALLRAQRQAESAQELQVSMERLQQRMEGLQARIPARDPD